MKARPQSRLSSIKTAQKESVIFRVMSALVHQASLENPRLEGWYVNRAELSPGKSVCYVYLYSARGIDGFDEARKELVLYKPSMRKSLATEMNARYTADIVFLFDEQLDKTLHIERLLTTVKERDEAQLLDTPDLGKTDTIDSSD